MLPFPFDLHLVDIKLIDNVLLVYAEIIVNIYSYKKNRLEYSNMHFSLTEGSVQMDVLDC